MDPWVLIKSKHNEGSGFYYDHNLFWVGSSEPYWNEPDWQQRWLAGFEFINNIFIFDGTLKRPTGPVGSEHLSAAGGNIVIAAEANEAILSALLRNGGQFLTSATQLKFGDPAGLDFTLRPGSRAIDAGQPQGAAQLRRTDPRPSFDEVIDGQPDVGPFELGAALNADWPRPRRTVFDIHPPTLISGRHQPPQLIDPPGQPRQAPGKTRGGANCRATGTDSGRRSPLPLSCWSPLHR